ncbi:DNA lyase [Ectothiorhodospiraceae bacterium 2226]|nr:DNA lyase [Ectothiorhodospiraceae bacterium 2226]
MRLWTLHPRYLDPRGLVALWREGLLAQKVLQGGTRGYRNHPQLLRFQAQPDPGAAIAAYLAAVWQEAAMRGYRFDADKLGARDGCPPLQETDGQLYYEWAHLLAKLRERAPPWYSRWQGLERPQPHPLFTIVPGPVRPWEIRPKEQAYGR